MIRRERIEQLEKHQFSIDHDKQYKYGELSDLAQFAITEDLIYMPTNVNTRFIGSIRNKTQVQRMAIAGALIAAEIDRLLNEAKEACYE